MSSQTYVEQSTAKEVHINEKRFCHWLLQHAYCSLQLPLLLLSSLQAVHPVVELLLEEQQAELQAVVLPEGQKAVLQAAELLHQACQKTGMGGASN